jgi:hypothetical protein
MPIEDQRFLMPCGPSADHRTRRATLELAFGVRPAEQDPPPDHRPSVRLPVVDNADMQRVARMVAETQRVRVRLPWDDQKVRQTMAAAAGLDRLGKSMAEAHRTSMRPAFDASKVMRVGVAGELQRAAQAMAEAHRTSMRPAFDASKVMRVGVAGELQRAAQAMAEAHRTSMRPAWDGEKMRQTMAAATGLHKIAKIMADSYQVRVPPLFDTQKLVGPMFGGELQRIAQAIAGAYRVPVPPLLDTKKLVGPMFGGEFQRIAQRMANAYRVPAFDIQGVVEVAQGIVDATIAVPSTATTGSLSVVDGSVPAKAPLFPGLMNPWEQVRCWDLQAWITFLAFLVAVAGLLVAMGQSRPHAGLSPEDLEKVIRIIQENGEPKTSTAAPNSTTVPTRSKSTRPAEVEKGVFRLCGHRLPRAEVRPVP